MVNFDFKGLYVLPYPFFAAGILSSVNIMMC